MATKVLIERNGKKQIGILKPGKKVKHTSGKGLKTSKVDGKKTKIVRVFPNK